MAPQRLISTPVIYIPVIQEKYGAWIEWDAPGCMSNLININTHVTWQSLLLMFKEI